MARGTLALLLLGLLVLTGPASVRAEEGLIYDSDSGDEACTGEDPQPFKDKIAALQKELLDVKQQLQTSATEWQDKVNALVEAAKAKETEVATRDRAWADAVADRDAINADLHRELKDVSTRLAALEAEQQSSPVPPSVVLAFAHARRAQASAAELYYKHAHKHTLKARALSSQAAEHTGRLYAAHGAPAARKALQHVRALLALLRAEGRVAAGALARGSRATRRSAGTTRSWRRSSPRPRRAAWPSARPGGAHAARAVDELEALTRRALAQHPSTRPYSVRHYPRLIVRALLTLPVAALVLLGKKK
ncbi:hypothetical protein QBZ16_005455 [Prototheca wickerhamii]|uniref:Uncharacterized protein n=1 Tax=Prototheca wickerhamii TaxID=3111 RepID=A0AAD9MJL0_PROWI|nr:hypothetical protein QBZ16_005455 [Prototheca wickerhamii]